MPPPAPPSKKKRNAPQKQMGQEVSLPPKHEGLHAPVCAGEADSNDFTQEVSVNVQEHLAGGRAQCT